MAIVRRDFHPPPVELAMLRPTLTRPGYQPERDRGVCTAAQIELLTTRLTGLFSFKPRSDDPTLFLEKGRS